jgi:glutamate dehydrogenase/leucine dehydrogenase
MMAVKSKSIFDVIKKRGLTTLTIQCNWKTNSTILYSAREWDDDFSFKQYNKSFFAHSVLTNNTASLNADAVNNLIQQNGINDYFSKILELMQKGKHPYLQFFYYAQKDIKVIFSQYGVIKGLNNNLQALTSGPMRRMGPEFEELDLVKDALDSARSMAFKNVIAGVPAGGSKITVQANDVNLNDLDEIGFYAYIADKTRCTTGIDMGFPWEMADIIRNNFTKSFCGGSSSLLGSTGFHTAYGTFLAVKEAVKFKFGYASLAKKKVLIQGLGATGYPMLKFCLDDGADVLISEINPDLINKAEELNPGIKIVEPGDIFSAIAEIFIPAAVGRIISNDVIQRMKFKVIVGCANNQLVASSQEEEFAIAETMAQKGILYVIQWAVNIGGVMAAWEEYVNREKAHKSNFYPELEKRCTNGVRDILSKAGELSITPTEYVYRTVESSFAG